MATGTRRAAGDPSARAGGLARIALLGALALVAVLMLRDSLARVLLPVDPAFALRIDPANADALAARAAQLLLQDPTDGARAEKLARQALRRSPVSAVAARTIAIARAFAGDAATARRMIAYSESLSRRDLPTQLWMIQDAVQHDDMPRALHHYDIALRSSDAAQPMLFPVLVGALGQPAVVAGLVDMLAAQPKWAPAFLEQAGHDAQDLDGLAALIGGLVRHGYAVPGGVRAEAGVRMTDAGHFAAAWQVYAADKPHVPRAAVHDPEFARLAREEGPFGWTVMPGDGLSVEPRRYGAHGALAYHVPTGAGGIVARQLLILPAGAFRLSGLVADRAAGSPPAVLHLRCADRDRPIAMLAADAPVFAGDFAVPAGCPAQWLEIVVAGGEAPMGASGAIGGLHVEPRAGRR